MEVTRQIVLVVQLFFSDMPREVRMHINYGTLEQCYEGARNVQDNVRRAGYENRKASAIAAGCYVELEVVSDPA